MKKNGIHVGTDRTDTAIIPAQPGFDVVRPLFNLDGESGPVSLQFEPVIAWAIVTYWGAPDCDDGFYGDCTYARHHPITAGSPILDGDDYAISCPGERVKIIFPYGTHCRSSGEALDEFVKLYERAKRRRAAKEAAA
jgi:hypothetical protein